MYKPKASLKFHPTFNATIFNLVFFEVFIEFRIPQRHFFREHFAKMFNNKNGFNLNKTS